MKFQNLNHDGYMTIQIRTTQIWTTQTHDNSNHKLLQKTQLSILSLVVKNEKPSKFQTSTEKMFQCVVKRKNERSGNKLRVQGCQTFSLTKFIICSYI